MCVSKNITLYGDDKWGHQQKSWSRHQLDDNSESKLLQLFAGCNINVFLGEKLVPDSAGKDDALVIDVSD